MSEFLLETRYPGEVFPEIPPSKQVLSAQDLIFAPGSASQTCIYSYKRPPGGHQYFPDEKLRLKRLAKLSPQSLSYGGICAQFAGFHSFVSQAAPLANMGLSFQARVGLHGKAQGTLA